MKRTEFLQETRKMRFEEAYEGCKSGCLTHAETGSSGKCVLGIQKCMLKKSELKVEIVFGF